MLVNCGIEFIHLWLYMQDAVVVPGYSIWSYCPPENKSVKMRSFPPRPRMPLTYMLLFNVIRILAKRHSGSWGGKGSYKEILMAH